MLSDAHAPIVLTQQDLAEELETGRTRVVCLDTERDEIANENPDNPNCTADRRIWLT